MYCTFTRGGCPTPHYLSYFVRVSVTVGLSSCEGLWRSIFTYANFLLPDSLQPANMQTTHPEHTCGRVQQSPGPAAASLSCLSRLYPRKAGFLQEELLKGSQNLLVCPIKCYILKMPNNIRNLNFFSNEHFHQSIYSN